MPVFTGILFGLPCVWRWCHTSLFSPPYLGAQRRSPRRRSPCRQPRHSYVPVLPPGQSWVDRRCNFSQWEGLQKLLFVRWFLVWLFAQLVVLLFILCITCIVEGENCSQDTCRRWRCKYPTCYGCWQHTCPNITCGIREPNMDHVCGMAPGRKSRWSWWFYLRVLAHVPNPLQTAGPLCPSGCSSRSESRLGGPLTEPSPHWLSPSHREPHPHSCQVSLSASFWANREQL